MIIRSLAALIADWLEKEKLISNDNRELYLYATITLLFELAPVIISCVIGIIMHMISESILFILPFIIIRKYSGGYHFKRPILCVVVSTAIIICALIVIRVLIHSKTALLILAVLVAVTVLCTSSPIDSEARMLSAKEIEKFGIIARIIAFSLFLLFLILLLSGEKGISVPIGVGIILPALLQLPCLIKELLSSIKSKKSH